MIQFYNVIYLGYIVDDYMYIYITHVYVSKLYTHTCNIPVCFFGSDRETMKNPGLATAALLLALMDV